MNIHRQRDSVIYIAIDDQYKHEINRRLKEAFEKSPAIRGLFDLHRHSINILREMYFQWRGCHSQRKETSRGDIIQGFSRTDGKK